MTSPWMESADVSLNQRKRKCDTDQGDVRAFFARRQQNIFLFAFIFRNKIIWNIIPTTKVRAFFSWLNFQDNWQTNFLATTGFSICKKVAGGKYSVAGA